MIPCEDHKKVLYVTQQNQKNHNMHPNSANLTPFISFWEDTELSKSLISCLLVNMQADDSSFFLRKGRGRNYCWLYPTHIVTSVQLLSCVQLFATPWIAARQASLSITNSRSSPRLTSFESVMPSSYLILCRPLLLLPPIPASIRVFSSESTLCMRWPKDWSFSFSIIPSKEIPGLISFRMDWLDLLAV